MIKSQKNAKNNKKNSQLNFSQIKILLFFDIFYTPKEDIYISKEYIS